ncbi:MAG: EndoU domain-containing protein [Anaerolineaceae bacterium]|nr:EndoU domain-containing protein [Anaerolineaceae bacterium]
MGTSKSGRHLNTRGSARSVSDFALVHSNEGTFKWKDVRRNGLPAKQIRLASGGHGQRGMDLLDKYHIIYKVTKTWANDVRIGIVPDHADRRKRVNPVQAWFPTSWSEKDIRRAGEHVAGLKSNRHSPNGATMWGVYKGVRVGAIKTYGKIATVFPDYDQSTMIRRKK